MTKIDRPLKAGDPHYTAYVGPPAEYDFMGATQFRLLCTLGLRDSHRILDFGCGSLRAGRLLIPYLKSGHYYGIEPNEWLIREAFKNELGNEIKSTKNPHLFHNDDFRCAYIGEKFDFILAQSIFSHAGRDLIAKTLGEFRESLSLSGKSVVTFIECDRKTDEYKGAGWVYPGVVRYRPETIHKLISNAGLAGRPIPWFHPRQQWYVLAGSSKFLPTQQMDIDLRGHVLFDSRFSAEQQIMSPIDREIYQLQSLARQLSAQRDALINSRSWRMTAPLRAIARALRSISRIGGQ